MEEFVRASFRGGCVAAREGEANSVNRFVMSPLGASPIVAHVAPRLRFLSPDTFRSRGNLDEWIPRRAECESRSDIAYVVDVSEIDGVPHVLGPSPKSLLSSHRQPQTLQSAKTAPSEDAEGIRFGPIAST